MIKILNGRKSQLQLFPSDKMWSQKSAKVNGHTPARSILQHLEVQLCLPAGLRACALALAVWVGSQEALRVLSSPAKRACCLLCKTLAVSTGGRRKKVSRNCTIANNNDNPFPGQL